MERHEELREILEREGLTQAQFARYIGSAPVTVNRWLRQRSADAQAVPEYALAFARAYSIMMPHQRRRLLAMSRAASA